MNIRDELARKFSEAVIAIVVALLILAVGVKFVGGIRDLQRRVAAWEQRR